MSRHRNVRAYSYGDDDGDDYYDEEDEFYEEEYAHAPPVPTQASLFNFMPSKADKKKTVATTATTVAQQQAKEDSEKLLSLGNHIKNVLGTVLPAQRLKELATTMNYDADRIVNKLLEEQFTQALPSPAGVIDSQSLGQGSAFASGLIGQSTGGGNSDAAAKRFGAKITSISSNSKPAMPMHAPAVPVGGNLPITPFTFDEPSPDDVAANASGIRRQKPVITVKANAPKVGKKAGKSDVKELETMTRNISIGKTSAGPSVAVSRNTTTSSAVSTSSSGVGGASKKKGKVKTIKEADHVEHDRSKGLVNMVVIGHVDAGKSTIMGHLLYRLKYVNQKEMHKNQKESKELGKPSFSFAWVMDAHEEERARGVTMDVGIKHFETESKRVNILDAPGHRDFLANMIAGAAQADVAVLVVPAPDSEFESGFRRDGQTQEHAMLVRYFGIQQLIVAVNKMDLLEWDETQFIRVKTELLEFLLKSGYTTENVRFVPISGLSGINLVERIDPVVCPWYDGPCLVEAIDAFQPTQRPAHKPVRLAIGDVYKSMGTGVTVAGKLEAGVLSVGDDVVIAPTMEACTVKVMISADKTVTRARAGENIEVGLSGIDIQQLLPGNIICAPSAPIPVVTRFDARIACLDPMKIPMIKGSQYVMHLQTIDMPVTIVKILTTTGTKDPKKNPRCVGKGQQAIVRIQTLRPVCIELFESYRPFGRFLLLSRGTTYAAGTVSRIVRLAPKAGEEEEVGGGVSAAGAGF